MLNFHTWFEQNWKEQLPEKEVPANESGINTFVSAMADPKLNSVAVFAAMNHRETHEVRHEGPISDNLLLISSPMLKNAKGVITNVGKKVYAFFVEGRRAGNLLIQAPPSIFDREDELLLKGILMHELRHATDWLNPDIQVEPTSRYVHDIGEYAKNLGEARSHAEQLRYLVRKVGDPNKVKKLLETGGSGVYRMNKQLLPYAMAFLENYPTTEQIFTQPPAIVREESVAVDAARRIAQIVKLMLFRNFVKKV